VEQTTQTSLVTPAADEVSEPLQDGVEQDHVSPWGLEESPKSAHEIVPRPSTVEHDDMHEMLDNLPERQDGPILDHPIGSDGSVQDFVDISVGSQALKTVLVTEDASVIDGGMPMATDQNDIVPQRQEVHPSKNIQLGLELWERVREYDARSVAEASAGFMPVLTRNRKQKLKVQHVLASQPPKSRARGDSHLSAQ
jgi:hypothetical protein